MDVDVLLVAPVQLTFKVGLAPIIYENEIHAGGASFNQTVTDRFLVWQISANSIADVQSQMKTTYPNGLTNQFLVFRAQQYQDVTKQIAHIDMDISVPWQITLLYPPSAQRNDKTLIQVQ